MKVIFAITTALAATSAVNAAGALRANNRQLEVCILTSSAFVYNLHLHRNLLCSHHMFYCNNFYYRTVGVLQDHHPRARVASLVVDLARARVESQVADLVHQATGAHPTSGVSLGLIYPSFFHTLHLFPFAHNI